MIGTDAMGGFGRKSAEQKLRERLRGASAATCKYGIGGREKTTNRPRPITLPKIELRDLDGEGEV